MNNLKCIPSFEITLSFVSKFAQATQNLKHERTLQPMKIDLKMRYIKIIKMKRVLKLLVHVLSLPLNEAVIAALQPDRQRGRDNITHMRGE